MEALAYPKLVSFRAHPRYDSAPLPRESTEDGRARRARCAQEEADCQDVTTHSISLSRERFDRLRQGREHLRQRRWHLRQQPGGAVEESLRHGAADSGGPGHQNADAGG